MKNIFLSFLAILFLSGQGLMAQVSITTSGTPVTQDFTGFTGAGFSPTPATGQLDSDEWAFTGFSDGNLNFGGTNTAGDYAKGVTPGGIFSGGIYAVDTTGIPSSPAIWIQPTGSDFTPGTITQRYVNNTGGLLVTLDVSYNIVYYNDQPRANSLNFSYSTDGVNFIGVPSLDFTTIEASDNVFYTETKSTTIPLLAIADQDTFFLRWSSDDVSGGGSRDEIGLDDISVTGTTGTATLSAEFLLGGASVLENAGTYDVEVNQNISDTCVVSVSDAGTGTAVSGTDYTFTSPTQLTFSPSTGITTLAATVTINDNMMVDPDRTVVLVLDSVFNCEIASNDTFVLTIENDDLPLYPIDLVTDDANGDGEADSLGTLCELRGIVHGIDFNGGNSIDFFFIDGTGGIGLFSSNNFGYTVTEGDSISVTGTISSFNGKAQISPDTLIVISSGNPLKTPVKVDSLGEFTESEFIFIDSVVLADPAQWPSGGSANVDIVTQNGATLSMRIDSDTNIPGTTPPPGLFRVTGLGDQFDGSSLPKDAGYQIKPRRDTDIEPIVALGFSFVPSAINANEGAGVTNFDVDVAPGSSSTLTVDVVFDAPNSSAALGTDFDDWSDTTLTFTSGQTVQGLSINVLDDAVFTGDRTAVFKLRNATGGPALGDSTLTITIIDDEYPVYTIDQVRGNDTDGVADSIGVRCELRGIVYGKNLRPNGNGVQFSFRSGGRGIGLFAGGINYYTVTQGDSIHVRGTISAFNGLSQINPDTIILVSQGNPIDPPTVVTSLGEDTESEYVKLECVTLVDPSVWGTGGSGFNAEITNGTETFTLRVDVDIDDVYNWPAPQGYFDVAGIGGQFDSGTPADGGYQLLPFDTTNFDILPPAAASFVETNTIVVDENAGTLSIEHYLINAVPETLRYDVTVNTAQSTAVNGSDFNFTNVTIDVSAPCQDTVAAAESLEILTDSDVEGTETIVLDITPQSGVAAGTATQLTIEITDVVGIEDLLPANAIRMFPNPANSNLRLEASLPMTSLTISNLIGQTVLAREVNGSQVDLNIANLPDGIYLMRVETKEGFWTSKWVKQ